MKRDEYRNGLGCISVTNLTVGMVRVCGAVITGLRTSKSGLTTYITAERNGMAFTERISPDAAVFIRDPATL